MLAVAGCESKRIRRVRLLRRSRLAGEPLSQRFEVGAGAVEDVEDGPAELGLEVVDGNLHRLAPADRGRSFERRVGAGVGQGRDEAVAVLGREVMAIQAGHGGESTVLRHCSLQVAAPSFAGRGVGARRAFVHGEQGDDPHLERVLLARELTALELVVRNGPARRKLLTACWAPWRAVDQSGRLGWWQMNQNARRHARPLFYHLRRTSARRP